MSPASTHIDTVRDGPPTLKTVVNFLLIFVTFVNYTAQRWNEVAATRMGHTKDSYGLGASGDPRASPLAVCPFCLRPLDNEAFWGLCED